MNVKWRHRSCPSLLLRWFDKSALLSLYNKFMYSHVADLCEHWCSIVDICNGWDGPHSPSNAAQKQTWLLDMLAWVFRWKELHDEMVKEKRSTEYSHFTEKTWFCIKSLLLAHITVIQIYCVTNGKSISAHRWWTLTQWSVFLDLPGRWWVAAPTSWQQQGLT